MKKSTTITASGSGFQLGDVVELSGVKGNNGRWKVEKISGNQIEVLPIVKCPECNIEYSGWHPQDGCPYESVEKVMES